MAEVKHVAGRLDRYSNLGDLLANERARAVLHQELGAEMFQNPAMGMGQPLLVLERFAPAVVNEEVLTRIEVTVIGREVVGNVKCLRPMTVTCATRCHFT